MKANSIKQRFIDRSIFLKILSVIVLSAVIVNIIVTIFFNVLVFTPVKSINQFVFKCANYILDDLESSFDLEKAISIADDFDLDFRHEYNGQVTTSSETIPGLNQFKIQKIIGRPDQFWGFHKGKMYLILKRPFGTYIVIPKFFQNSDSHETWIIGVLLLLSIIFIAIYYSLKRLLSPINELRKGVEQVKDGNFDYTLEVTCDDELGNLTSAFNGMTDQVKSLIYSKEQLLLNVSHELRSPLTRMKLSMEFLPDNKRKDDLLDDIIIMEAMVTELLETAKLHKEAGALHKTEVDLTEIIRDVCQKLSGRTPGVECYYPSGAVVVSVDESRIRTVLKNLMENAIKYSGESVQPVQIKVNQSETEVTIEIADSGEGIPETDLPHIFEPFYRVDKSRSKETGGYGLGLSMCRQIIEAHDGKIGIRSSLGEGTTVNLVLPTT